MPIASNLMASKLSPVPQQARAMPYISEDRPAYMVRDGKAYIGNTYLDEGALIYLDVEPNLQLQPVNKLAAIEYEKFLKKLDALGEAYKKKSSTYQNGQPYIYMAELPRRQHMIDMAKDPARRDELYYSITHRQSVPIYPANRGPVPTMEVIGGDQQPQFKPPAPSAGTPEMKAIN